MTNLRSSDDGRPVVNMLLFWTMNITYFVENFCNQCKTSKIKTSPKVEGCEIRSKV